ncbi:MAG: hypothetical protein JO051_13495 [Acidobacteriaceae bacterium]|nr:hypothetical protein [Acidobacteriaceae bacterium]
MRKVLSLSPLKICAVAAVLCATIPASADSFFAPGNLVLSRSVYAGTPATVTVGQQLPPVCGTAATCPATAVNDGTYPYVFNNNTADGSFGITSPIYLDEITTGGQLINTLNVTDTLLTNSNFNLVTSFSSKSELALNLSTDHSVITFMGYNAPVNTLDVSNSNTPGVIDPTNPVGTSFYRVVGQVDANGNITTTETNAYSGNNGRAAILAGGYYFTVGNNNNGSGTPANIIDSTGVEIIVPGSTPGVPQMVGNFSITQVTNPSTGKPYAADKAGKDNNFRGLTVFDNTVYVDKGSGGNGINTVYQVGAAGTLPTLATAATEPLTILPGFPVTLAKAATAQNPFGIFFANANTVYVADEGDGTAADAATSPNAGLEKWVLQNGTWNRVYVLQNGLNLGQPYSIPNYPSSLNPSTDGLRNITGRVNSDGTVTIWAITSTVSASGDQGADPNRLVVISDVLANTDPAIAANEQFGTLRTAGFGEVLRGISLTPGTSALPAAPQYAVTVGALFYNRAHHNYAAVVSLLNNTNSAASGPLSVLISGLPAGVAVTNATSSVGNVPAVQVLPSGGTLSPGASASATVTFTDSSNAPIQFTPSVVNQ